MPDYTPTFADLCNAIANGGVIATLDGSVYEVNAFELRRYFSQSRILPALSTMPRPSDQESEDPNTRTTQRH